MSRKIRSEKGLFGATNYYDEHGRYLGYAQEGLFDGDEVILDDDDFDL